MRLRPIVFAMLAGLATGMAANGASAQAGTIRIIVGFPAGGTIDVVARVLAALPPH